MVPGVSIATAAHDPVATPTWRPGVPRRADRRRAVVVGAGFGGIASALRLRAGGLDVTLVDRLDQLGGRARVFHRDGFVFDAGPTVITAPFLIDELFALFGRDRRDYVEFVPVEPWYRIQWEDGATFDYGGTVEDTLEEIRRFEPRDMDGYLALLREAESIYRIGFERLGDAPFHTAGSMVRALPHMMRLRTHRSTWQFVSSHLRNERLRQVFTFQPLLVGGNPYRTSCIYALIQVLERRYGIHYAMGGTGALVAALGRLMEEVGIEIRLGETVEAIETRGRTKTGVRNASGETVPADLVVSNADPVHVYRHLLPDRKSVV